MKKEYDTKKFNILDCTFRDGGYYNNWHFQEKLVNKYLAAISKTKVTHVEIGFRFKSKDGFKGPNAYTSDDYLRRLKIPKELKIGVMINASDLVGDLSLKDQVLKLFPEDKSISRIDFVRIASHYHELEVSFEATILLKQLGFFVGLNLMQISERSEGEIESFIDRSKKYPIDVIYCADSVGGLEQVDVENIYKIFLKNCTHIPYGFHAHDNLHLALLNTSCAMKSGATWLDCTISGMGRGPGNTKTEELLLEIGAKQGKYSDLTALFELLYDDFYKMKLHYQWGTNIFYYMSGKWSIHPTYVQVMLSDSRYDALNIISVLEYLRDKPSRTQFVSSLLSENASENEVSYLENWNPSEIFEKKDVLIIGNGQSIVQYSDEIINYINKYKPIVVALNYNSKFDFKDIDVRVSSHPLRIHASFDQFLGDDKIIVLPFSSLDDNELNLVSKNKRFKNFNVKINQEGYSLDNDKYCEIPSNLTIAYALGLVSKGKCSDIYVVGIDGYEFGDLRNLEIENIFKLFTYRKITSLTHTNIKGLKVKSIYGF